MNPLIDGLVKGFRASNEIGDLSSSDVFELFAASLVLGDQLLSQVELTDLLLDKHTVGLDVAAIEVNGQLVWDRDDVDDVCDGAAHIEVSIHTLQAKQSEHINSTDILALGEAVKRFLLKEGLADSPKLESLSEALHHLFSTNAQKLRSQPSVHMSFVTTAPHKTITDKTVTQRLESAKELVKSVGFVGEVTARCFGADDLHDLHVRQFHANKVDLLIPKSVSLPAMPGIKQAFVGLISVAELLKMICRPDGSLDEQVFFDNVRGFQGDANPVNRKIVETLGSDARSLLPVLNNGVTVVAQSYTPLPADHFLVEGYQIVNGCQTSHCAYIAKDELGADAENVFVPLRLVITDDDDVAISIIRATNSQTEVKEDDLVALSKFQKRLEEFYRMDSAEIGLTYERRAGQFYGLTVTKTRLVSVADQLKSVSAMLLNRPHLASRYPSKLYAEAGDSVFRDEHKILPYVVAAYAAYRLENAFRGGLDSRFKVIRYHILMVVAYQILGEPPAQLHTPTSEKQANNIIAELRAPQHVELFKRAAEFIETSAGGSIPTRDRLKRPGFTTELIQRLKGEAANSN
ncbi:AIPR family protein [Nonomuraea sp. NPDC050383]|uniref:AIPR family protein n=1 Tax=Nonomuraea sp. NPDC050383 TaxID=3364362 RepID=UPI0037A17A26